MVVQPERRCLPLEVESISLHREPRPARSRPPRQRRSLRSRVAAVLRAMTARIRG